MIRIKEVRSQKDYQAFADLAKDLYQDNPYWVQPIRSDYLKYLQGQNNDLKLTPHKLFLAYEDQRVLGRVLAYIDQDLNKYQGVKVGYFSEYEAVDRQDVANALLDACVDFFADHDIEIMRGPNTLPGGDDHRGFIIDNFQEVPSIINTYNLPYYAGQMESYGMEKHHDVFAYTAEKSDLQAKVDRLERTIPLVEKRYNFHVDTVNIKGHLQKEKEDIHQILQESLPKEWEDFKPITREEIDNIFNQLKFFAVEDLIAIARTQEGRPIGFALSLPDYNELLIRFKGKLGPIQLLEFFFKRKKIKRVRMFVLFVVPDYHHKGVSAAIYYKVFKNAVKLGYEKLEGSTIWDYNQPMINDIEKFGASKNIVYRIYKKKIKN